MFKHILLPLDDSGASRNAARKTIAFARQTGARITGYHALPDCPRAVYGDGYRFPQMGNTKQELHDARVHLIEGTARAARDAGVRFDTLVDHARTPVEGIVDAARKRRCDAIFMGTNGRSGLARLALGSVTGTVIAHSDVPVLVYR